MMRIQTVFLVLLLLGCVRANRLESLKTVDDYLNICIGSDLPKDTPGPEDKLFDKCAPYKDLSCCTKQVSEELHRNTTWYNFHWDHCRTLSNTCKNYFIYDLCHYECTPNGGPWLVEEDRTWRKERYYKTPLCASECTAWFNACKDDFTCVVNWSQDFSWKSGVQTCPKDKNGTQAWCKKIEDVYKDSKHFCEKVWDDSWKVVNDNEPCMRISFQDDAIVDKNRQVARARAEELVSSSGTLSFTYLSVWLLLVSYTLKEL